MARVREAVADHRDQGSRFLALVFPGDDPESVEARVRSRRERRRVCHHASAWRTVVGGRLVEQARDDGEVGRA